MTIAFKNARLRALLSDDRRLTKRYGPDMARQVQKRMRQLKDYDNLRLLMAGPGGCHLLTRERAGSFALNLPRGWRLVFEPAAPPPRLGDGGIDLKRVSSVVITELVDYHRG